MGPKSLQEAFQMLDTLPEHFPYAAILYLRSHPHTKEIEEKINSSLTHAFNERSSCLYYMVVAEQHLSLSFIDPVISLFTTKSEEINELMEEQASFLLQQLTKQYPDVVMDKVIKALDYEIEKDNDTIHFYLFDIFPFVNKGKYTPWFIKTMQKQFILNDSFLQSVMYLGIAETIPFIRQVLDHNTWNPDEVNIEELEEIYTMLVKGNYPKDAPIPFLQSRKTWNEYYMDIESCSLTEEEIEALSRIPFPYLIMDKSARNEPCHCGMLDGNGNELKYKDCCFEEEAAIVNLPRFTKETLPN